MKPTTRNTWRRAALMTILGTALCSSALANESMLPANAVPNLKLPTQITKEEERVERARVSSEGQMLSEKAVDPNALYADKRLPNPYKAYVWRRDVTAHNEKATLPVAFRTAQSYFKDMPDRAAQPLPDRDGLNTLQMSGSSQPSMEQYKELAQVLKTKASGPIYVVDLRQETHLYVNDMPVSLYGDRDWGNVGESRTSILQAERQLTKTLPGTTIETAEIARPAGDASGKKGPVKRESMVVNKVQTEEQVTRELGLHYMRITATDHIWPSAESIDQFIAFYKKLPSNAWIHFHCEAGHGRTTTFMTLYDILNNPQVPLKDILDRQYMIGGIQLVPDEDLLPPYRTNNDMTATYTSTENEDDATSKGSWQDPYTLERALMIQKFYRYVQQNKSTNFSTSWSEWLHPDANVSSNKNI